jgi:hypothetical protein
MKTVNGSPGQKISMTQSTRPRTLRMGMTAPDSHWLGSAVAALGPRGKLEVLAVGGGDGEPANDVLEAGERALVAVVRHPRSGGARTNSARWAARRSLRWHLDAEHRRSIWRLARPWELAVRCSPGDVGHAGAPADGVARPSGWRLTGTSR